MMMLPKKFEVEQLDVGYLLTDMSFQPLAAVSCKDDLIDLLARALPSPSAIEMEITGVGSLDNPALIPSAGEVAEVIVRTGGAEDAAPEPAPEPEPEPAPEPEPEPAPEPEPTTAEDAAPDYRTGELDDDEVLRIVGWLKQDLGSGEMAKRLNRDPRGFYHKVNQVRDEVAAAEQKVAARQSSKAEPVTALKGFVWPVPNNQTWRVEDDIDMLERLLDGEKPGDVAIVMEVDKPFIAARFRRLVPQPTRDNQKKMVEQLHAYAAAVAARVAAQ